MAKKTNHKRKKLSPQEVDIRRKQRTQEREIRTIMTNIGFDRVPYIDGKEFIYDGRTSEMDDIFVIENIIIITEYTIGDPSAHLAKKNLFYSKINSDKRAFIDFLLSEEKLSSFADYYKAKIEGKYSKNQLKLRVLYCSMKSVSQEYKDTVNGVKFFDYHIVQYFKSITKVIKRSSKYEFAEFLDIKHSEFGENVFIAGTPINEFSGHIVPEERTSYKEGYKIVSFYIDAESLIKRAYVLRQEGWREKGNIGYYQRLLVSKKISKMRKYLAEQKRVFINNIIAIISEESVRFKDEYGNALTMNDKGQFIGEDIHTVVTPAKIEIKDSCNIIGIIDGQHRTYAYHEGTDTYETDISKFRKRQDLLVTSILYPSSESEEKRRKFEAELFIEINSNQTNVSSQLKQEISSIINPFSTIAIGKNVLLGLNKSGPLSNLIGEYSYEKDKIKTASIVSFGLKPLIKLDNIKSNDSLFYLWSNDNKQLLKSEDFALLDEYIKFNIEQIRNLFIGLKANINSNKWQTYSKKNPSGLLTVTFINGVLNVLRLLIQNNKIDTIDNYKIKFKGIDKFDFKSYKSSQYRKMGLDIYNQYFN